MPSRSFFAGDALAGSPTSAPKRSSMSPIPLPSTYRLPWRVRAGPAREGLPDAPVVLVHDAIENGAYGRIAVTYAEWSVSRSAGPRAVDRLTTARKGDFFANRRLSADPACRNDVDLGRDRSGRKLLSSWIGAPARRVIEISGDGRLSQRWPSR